MEKALRSQHHLSGLEPQVQDTGEQRWGIECALQNDIPVPLLAQPSGVFYESRDETPTWAKAVALLRHEYGGHPLEARRDRREPVTRSG